MRFDHGLQLEGAGTVVCPMGAALLEFGISIAGELIGAWLDSVVGRQRERIRQRKDAAGPLNQIQLGRQSRDTFAPFFTRHGGKGSL